MGVDSNPKPKEAKAKETEKAPFVPYEVWTNYKVSLFICTHPPHSNCEL